MLKRISLTIALAITLAAPAIAGEVFSYKATSQAWHVHSSHVSILGASGSIVFDVHGERAIVYLDGTKFEGDLFGILDVLPVVHRYGVLDADDKMVQEILDVLSRTFVPGPDPGTYRLHDYDFPDDPGEDGGGGDPGPGQPPREGPPRPTPEQRARVCMSLCQFAYDRGFKACDRIGADLGDRDDPVIRQIRADCRADVVSQFVGCLVACIELAFEPPFQREGDGSVLEDPAN